MKADFEMSTKWLPNWKRKELTTFGEIITHHRGQSAHLYSDLSGSKGTHHAESAEQRSRSKPRTGGRNQTARHDITPEWKGLKSRLKKRCTWYNTITMCRKGRDCPDVHECDFRGCGRKHSRAECHPIKPP